MERERRCMEKEQREPRIPLCFFALIRGKVEGKHRECITLLKPARYPTRRNVLLCREVWERDPGYVATIRGRGTIWTDADMVHKALHSASVSSCARLVVSMENDEKADCACYGEGRSLASKTVTLGNRMYTRGVGKQRWKQYNED